MNKEKKEKLTPTRAKQIVRNIHQFLNSVRFQNNDWQIKLRWINCEQSNKILLGQCHYPNEIIYINPYHEIVKTFIHEYLHMKYPSNKNDEIKIEKMEQKITEHLSDRQIINIAKKLLLGHKISLEDFEKIPDPAEE